MDGPFPNSRQQPQKVSKDKTSNKKIYGKINHKADRVVSPKEVDSVFLLCPESWDDNVTGSFGDNAASASNNVSYPPYLNVTHGTSRTMRLKRGKMITSAKKNRFYSIIGLCC